MFTHRLCYILLLVLLIPCWVIAYHYDIDLVNLHLAAGFTHTDLSRVYAQNGNFGRWFYPPFSLVMIYPFGSLPYILVKWIWIALQTVAYFIFWRSLYGLYPVLKEKKFFWGWLIVFIIAINPIHNNYQSNNVQLMLIAVLALAEVLSQKEKSSSLILSGILVSLATWYKVFPGFMAVYYFLFKPGKVKLGTALGFLIGLIVPILFFGIEQGLQLYKDFYFGLSTYSKENNLTLSPDIMCLPSLIERFFTFVVPLSSNTIALLIKLSVLIGSGLFFGSAFLTKRKEKILSIHWWALAMALTVFLNPSTRPHYYIFYVPLFVSVLEILWKKKPVVELAVVFVSMLFIAFTTDAVLGKGLNDRLEFLSLPTVGSMLMILLMSYLLKRKNINGVFGDHDGDGHGRRVGA